MNPYHVFVKCPGLGWKVALYVPKEGLYFLCADELGSKEDYFDEIGERVEMPE